MKKTVEKRRKLKFDEIHQLTSEIAVHSEAEYEELSEEERKERKEKFWDCLWGWLLDGWAAGLLFVGTDKDIPDLTAILNYIYPRTGESVSDLYDKNITDPEAFERMFESEANRCFNSGVLEAGKGEQGLMKVWNTMGDERVRVSHDFLEDVEVPYDEEFVTIGGDSALAPGMFSDPSNNCACRCWLTYKRNGNSRGNIGRET